MPITNETSRRRILGVAPAFLLLALVLALTAWPRLQAAWVYQPVDSAIARYFESNTIPVAQLEALAARATQAISLQDHYRYHDGLSFIRYLQALDAPPGAPGQREALALSLASAREVLRQAPANPATWLRAAQIEAVMGAPASAVVDDLAMSMLTGRVEPTLLLPRLELAYRYLAFLDDEGQALLLDQTALAWTVRRGSLARSLRDGRLDAATMSGFIGRSRPGLYTEMEAVFEKASG